MLVIGDRVISLKFGEGTVIIIGNYNPTTGVEFDKQNDLLHSLNGNCARERGWFFKNDGSGEYGGVRLLNEKKFEPINQKQHLHKIMKECGYNNIQMSMLVSRVNDDTKNVKPQLEQFIGEYKLEDTNDLWLGEFIHNLISTINNIVYYCRYYDDRFMYNGTNYKTKKIDFDVEIFKKQIFEQLKTINASTGTLKVNGRNEKVLKYLKKCLSKIIEISDEQFESLNFCKMYNMNNQKKQLYLVISKEILDTVGMSSLAPNKGEKNKVWSSCQTLYLDTNKRNGELLSNLLDVDSLICYVTDKSETEMQNCRSIKRNTMLQRNILRLVKKQDEEKYDVILDRAYPNAKYSMHIADILQKKLKNTDMSLLVPCGYSSGQEDDGYGYQSLKNLAINNEYECYFSTEYRVDFNDCYPYQDNISDIEDGEFGEDCDGDECTMGGTNKYELMTNIGLASDYMKKLKEEKQCLLVDLPIQD